MTPTDFYISAIENYIDIFRYSSKIINPDEYEYAIIKLSKYAYRVYHALHRMNIQKNNLLQSKLEARMNILGTIAKELKGHHTFPTTTTGNTSILSTLKSVFSYESSLNENLLKHLLKSIFQDILLFEEFILVK